MPSVLPHPQLPPHVPRYQRHMPYCHLPCPLCSWLCSHVATPHTAKILVPPMTPPLLSRAVILTGDVELAAGADHVQRHAAFSVVNGVSQSVQSSHRRRRHVRLRPSTASLHRLLVLHPSTQSRITRSALCCAADIPQHYAEQSVDWFFATWVVWYCGTSTNIPVQVRLYSSLY